MFIALLITIIVALVVIIVLVAIINDLKLDLQDTIREKVDDVRFERDEKRTAQEKCKHTERDFEIVGRERDFWRDEAIKLGYPV